MPIPRSPIYRMADTLMGGRLLARLRELRSEGRSWDDISRVLYAEHHVVVSSRALRDWGATLGLDDPDTEPEEAVS